MEEPIIQSTQGPEETRELTLEEIPMHERPGGLPGLGAHAQRPPHTGVIYIGRKNVMTYVLAVVTQFNSGEQEVVVKARGRAISRAVDVTQIVKNRFFNALEVTGFKVETEELTNEDGSMSRVSSVTLTMKK